MMRRRPCRPRCGCCRPNGPIVHPVKENVVHCCTEETVKHVHPSHTTVKNHHIIKNEHVFPHSTSVENTCEEVDIKNGNNNAVAGAMHNNQPMHPGHHMNHGNHGNHGNHMHHGKKPCCKPNKWR